MVYKRRVVEIDPNDFKEPTDNKRYGKRIVQLDYETGEYVGTYPSLTALARDYGLERQRISKAMSRTNCVFKQLPKYEILFILETEYVKLFKTDQYDMDKALEESEENK